MKRVGELSLHQAFADLLESELDGSHRTAHAAYYRELIDSGP